MVRIAIALLLLMLLPTGTWAQEKRVALVIGNAAYAHASTLSSPPMDADAMEAAFKRMKFDVVVRLKDLGVKPLADALSAFRREATGADMAVIYYSGHGIEIDGVNYLVPIDAKLDDHLDAPLQAIRLPDVLRQLDGSRRLRVVILDACRDNPFQQRLAQLPDRKSVSVGKGFVAVREADLGQRTLVAFAAREGTTAEDRRGRLSTYTDALLKHIEKPGLEIGLLFRQVRDEVYRETKGRQQPQEYGSLGGEALYLSAPPATVPVTPAPAASQIRLSEAAEAWDRIKDSPSITLLERFAARYRDTFYAEMAQARVEDLKRQQVAIATPQPPPKEAPREDEQKKQQVAVVIPPKAPPPAPSPTSATAPGTGPEKEALKESSLARTIRLITACYGVETLVGNERRCLKPQDSFKDCADCPEMVVVPAGEFMMGSPKNEEGRSEYEDSQHRVTIAKPFAIGRFAVTQGEFAAFVGETKHSTGDKCRTYENGEWDDRTGRSFRNPGIAQDNRHPVVCANWDDAKAFVAWFSKKTSKPYRLLTEAEREYATRAGTTTPFWWGTSASPSANYDTNNLFGRSYRGEWRNKTVAVDSFEANPWGLYNVHGNVWEWVEDCWHENYQGAPVDGSAWTTGECKARILRGGSWFNDPSLLRSASRSWNSPGHRNVINGFRLARTLSP
jgi:formylglycine-generating enzyme required for sulfatase activity/uncharacterized caspase-like protein